MASVFTRKEKAASRWARPPATGLAGHLTVSFFPVGFASFISSIESRGSLKWLIKGGDT